MEYHRVVMITRQRRQRKVGWDDAPTPQGQRRGNDCTVLRLCEEATQARRRECTIQTSGRDDQAVTVAAADVI